MRYAAGGRIPGPHPDDDSIPVLLSPSEARADRETVRSMPDPWDACLDVDPFTGQPEHRHGESCDAEECCE